LTEDKPKLIERAFPLRQASLDSVHEKNVRRGHISTLHIWPARRPLAASRAALIATLLPDPGTADARRELIGRIGGKVVEVAKSKKLPNGKVETKVVEETVGGILHWGREASPDLLWIREEIRRAYGGRAPRVLDTFAGGGAIPLEAMRLGCEATAIDINPVAWFVLRCTIEYPQRLVGKHRPLPKFATESPGFMQEFFKGNERLTKKQLERNISAVQSRFFPPPEVDLSWQVRAWGWWVLHHVRAELEKFYPTIDGEPPIAYLWARTVTCKNCRAAIPLLKTFWLCRKNAKRILLTLTPDSQRTKVVVGVQKGVPVAVGNVALRREHDKRIGQGTMSRSGAWCPCCGKPGTVAMRMADIAQEGIVGRIDHQLIAVVCDTARGKAYRPPVPGDLAASIVSGEALTEAFQGLPYGLPQQAISPASTRSISCQNYGLSTFSSLFTRRQQLANAVIIRWTREAGNEMDRQGYTPDWREAIFSYLCCIFDKYLDYGNTLASWYTQNEQISHLFNRFALPMKWDFAETSPIGGASGSYASMADSVAASLCGTLAGLPNPVPAPTILLRSAEEPLDHVFDAVVTDPPYYAAVSYADLSDFFYVWLRLLVGDKYPAFEPELSPKAGEIVQHVRDDKSRKSEKEKYENGMASAFKQMERVLTDEGRLAVVFAHKDPLAWETLVSAIIRSGFEVRSSWPIQTEMPNRSRGYGQSALSSSVWLVCAKRPVSSRPGWDNQVLRDMTSLVERRLREYWDAGIRGPDFVWAATGPALEAYSKHPVVKKANAPGEVMSVDQFLRHVRRMVVEFVVGRLLTGGVGGASTVAGLDDVTTYYLLHRYDFRFGDAPAGACILYAVSCGLSDKALVDDIDLLVRTGSAEPGFEEIEELEEDEEAPLTEGTGSTFRLKTWSQRRFKGMGYDVNGRPAPLIDRAHRLMHLWRAGDLERVNQYLEDYALVRNALFHQVLQALIELSDPGDGERSLLERISNHISGKGGTVKTSKTLDHYEAAPNGGGG